MPKGIGYKKSKGKRNTALGKKGSTGLLKGSKKRK